MDLVVCPRNHWTMGDSTGKYNPIDMDIMRNWYIIYHWFIPYGYQWDWNGIMGLEWYITGIMGYQWYINGILDTLMGPFFGESPVAMVKNGMPSSWIMIEQIYRRYTANWWFQPL